MQKTQNKKEKLHNKLNLFLKKKKIFVLKKNQKTVTFDSLATTEIEQFVESGLIDINIENLAIAFSDIEFPTKNITTSISDEEVLAYLTIEDLETIIYED